MFDTLAKIVHDVLAVWGFFSITGFVVYKAFHLPTWEDGLTNAFTASFRFLYEAVTGNDTGKAAVNTALLCYDKEALQIVSRLDKHPYETPSLVSYIPNRDGCSWYDISAMGLAASYKSLENSQIAEMAHHIVQNFFLETRGYHINISIRIASPERLYFCIPLSEDGQRFINKQDSPGLSPGMEGNTGNSLEEVFDIFPDQDGQPK